MYPAGCAIAVSLGLQVAPDGAHRIRWGPNRIPIGPGWEPGWTPGWDRDGSLMRGL
jgi:hypothetical protein